MQPINLGKLRVERVVETEATLPMQMGLPDITAADLAELRGWFWDATLASDPAQAGLTISVHSYILQVDGRNILIDSCQGNDKKRCVPFADNLQLPYLEHFAATGLRPEDIHVVLCTHLHGDHVGWNTRLANGRWVPTFPNARHLFGRKDVELFSQPKPGDWNHEAFADSVAPILDAGLADIVDGSERVHREIGDGVWLEDASGHSPGNYCVHAQRGGERAIFSGDCFHHPVQIVRPDVRFFADEDPVAASATRTRLLRGHADRDSVFFPAHFTGRGAGHVRARADGRLWFDFL
jgi:glyoxylase-like metal-dependent hydrolase (beta-lactamase superfamily II)